MSKPSKDKAQRRADRKRREAAAEAVRHAAQEERWRVEAARRAERESPAWKQREREERERRAKEDHERWLAAAPEREARRREQAYRDWLRHEEAKSAHCEPPRHAARPPRHPKGRALEDFLEDRAWREKEAAEREERARRPVVTGLGARLTMIGLLMACGVK